MSANRGFALARLAEGAEVKSENDVGLRLLTLDDNAILTLRTGDIDGRSGFADRLDRQAVNQPSWPSRSLGGARRRQRIRRSIYCIRFARTSPGYSQRAFSKLESSHCR